MNKESLKTLLVIAGATLFNSIFWNEKLGVNVSVFTMFIAGCVFFLYPLPLKNITGRGLFTAHLFTAAMVIFHNTLLSKIAFSTTSLLFIAFSQYRHRSLWYAGGSIISNYVFAIPNFIKGLKNITPQKISLSGLFGPIRILLLPLVIAAIFISIYTFANSVFSGVAADVITALENWFTHFFDWLSIGRFLFFMLGIFITGGLLLATRHNWFSARDMQKKDDLFRKKNNFIKWKESSFSDLVSVITGKPSGGVLALKTESTIGFISLVLLNLLLLFVNLIDVRYVWLGFTFNKRNMASYVHEGAGLLILSILLAMLVLLFFFRGNLNFYKKSVRLKYGAYLWILQNSILVISVFIRDNYYITHFGLAYKRIGLLFFLAMVLTGLFTVFLKIYLTKTTYYLLRINAWAGIFLLVFASAVNWDTTIAGYNLGRKSSVPVDVHFLLSLSDATLPLIEKNKDVLEKHVEGRSAALDFFEYRKRVFIETQHSYSWLSWNVADANVMNTLNTSTTLSLK